MANKIDGEELVPLAETLPTDAELRARECRALRELDLVRRMRRVVQRRDLFRAADEQKQKRRESPAAVAG